MSKLWIATGLTGVLTAGVLLYLRNRNTTSRALHHLADEAGKAHDGVRKYFRKATREADQELSDAIA